MTASVLVVPSPQLTVRDVTVVPLVEVKVVVTLCPTNVGFGDSVGVETTGTFPALTEIGNDTLALPA